MLDLISDFLLCSRISFVNAYLASSAKIIDPENSSGELYFYQLSEAGWVRISTPTNTLNKGVFGHAEDGIHTLLKSNSIIFPFVLSERESRVTVLKVSEPGMIKTLLFLTHEGIIEPDYLQKSLNFLSSWLRTLRCSRVSEALTWRSFAAKASAKIRDLGREICRVCSVNFELDELKRYEKMYGREAVELWIAAYRNKLEQLERSLDVAAYVSPLFESFIISEAWKTTEIKIEIEKFIQSYLREEGISGVHIYPRFNDEPIRVENSSEPELDDVLDLAINKILQKNGTYR